MATPASFYVGGTKVTPKPTAPAKPATTPEKVVVKTGQTLPQIAKENNTTVKAILADPANKVIAARVEAGQTPVFGNTKVTIPAAAPAATPAVTPKVTPKAEAPTSTSTYVGGTKVTPKTETPKTPTIAPKTDGSTYVGGTKVTPKVETTPKVTPTVTPDEEPLPEMPSETDMAAADAAYQDAVQVLGKKDVSFPKVGTILRYDPGKEEGTRIPVYADGAGGEFNGEESLNPVVPGSTGKELGSERTLAKDTFSNTLALLVGAKEAQQPWVTEMYNLASGFYKSGSTIEEALNLSLYDAKEKGLAPQFTKRFKGVFDLQEKLQKGEAVTVPTIAEFVKAQAAIGDIFREAGLTDLDNQDFIGNIIGAGNSVLDVGNLISSTFTTIDNAPKALRDTLNTYFPSVDRTSLAKALLTGTEGAQALDKKIKGISVLSAAGSQGISTDLATASDIAARGVDYGQALAGFGQVKDLERANTLAQFSGGTFTQKEAIGATFEQNKKAMDKAEAEKMKEIARFQGEAGLAPSALRGRNARTVI